jgi:hypothetical protein
MLHGRDQRPRWEDEIGSRRTLTTPVTRSIELNESVTTAAAEDGPDMFCQAYVVVGLRPSAVEKCFDDFRSTNSAHRMLVIVVQDNELIEPFIKVSEPRVCVGVYIFYMFSTIQNVY